MISGSRAVHAIRITMNIMHAFNTLTDRCIYRVFVFFIFILRAPRNGTFFSTLHSMHFLIPAPDRRRRRRLRPIPIFRIHVCVCRGRRRRCSHRDTTRALLETHCSACKCAFNHISFSLPGSGSAGSPLQRRPVGCCRYDEQTT